MNAPKLSVVGFIRHGKAFVVQCEQHEKGGIITKVKGKACLKGKCVH